MAIADQVLLALAGVFVPFTAVFTAVFAEDLAEDLAEVFVADLAASTDSDPTRPFMHVAE